MTVGLLYALGTLASWVGWTAFFRAVYLGVRLVSRADGMNVEGTRKGLVLAAVMASVCLLLTVTLPMDMGRPREPGLSLPIVWFSMGFQAWMIVLGSLMAVLRTGQAWLALTNAEARSRLLAAAAWVVFVVVFAVWQTSNGAPVTIIRGAIPISWATAAALVALGVVTVSAMAYAGRKAQSRGLSKTVVSHVALGIGCVVFGLPFVWLLITSFKEDRDLSSVHGIVWVPKVSETAEYLDPKNPLFATRYEGRDVRVQRYRELDSGVLQVEIVEPPGIRGITFEAAPAELREVPRRVPVVTGTFDGQQVRGLVVEELDGGDRRVRIVSPRPLEGTEFVAERDDVAPVRHVGLNAKNYPDSLAFLPPETNFGLVYLKNTLIIVIFTVIGTLLSCSLVAYAFSRMRFPGKKAMFLILLSTMMLPGAVTLLPTFLIFRQLGWIDTLYPLWVPAFFAGAFNVFLLRQFFMTVPMELEDAAKIDGCSYLRTYWQVMLPQVKPALAAIAIWTFMGAWNNFMGPLIYINSPENMPIAYAVQLFQGQRGGEQHLMMAFATMAMLPVLLLFFFAQKYFIEGVTLSGLGGR